MCNSAKSSIQSIIYKQGQCPPALPVAVLVKFEDYQGPTLDQNAAVPIVPIICNSNSTENMERQHLPLKFSWAITMHKSQGLTIPRAVIDLGLKEEVAGLAYVAISRVRKLSDLVIEPTSHERLTAVKLSSNFAFS